VKSLFAILSLLFIQNVQADSIWHCIGNESIGDGNDALVLHTGQNNTLTVFGDDGVKRFHLTMKSQGLNEEKTMYVYQSIHGQYMFLFMRVKDQAQAGFSVSDLDNENTRLWFCK
jgi:hypothetical protein